MCVLSCCRPGQPWFVSIFWPSSGRAHISLPVRQLLQCVLQQLVDYRGSEVEVSHTLYNCSLIFLPPLTVTPFSLPPQQLSVLQSYMALLFLVSTHCPDLQLELSRMANKLPKESLLLLLSQLRPGSLQAAVAAHCPLHQACPSLALVLCLFQNIQFPSGSGSSSGLPPVAVRTDSPACNLPQIGKLHITSRSPSPTSEQTMPPHTDSPTPHTSYLPTPSISPVSPTSGPSPAKRPRYSSAPTPLMQSPLRVQNSPKTKSLCLKRSLSHRVVYSTAGSVQQACKRRAVYALPNVLNGENAVYSSNVKKQRLSCENCEAGASHCCHCSE